MTGKRFKVVLTIAVLALGYFLDVFDIVLFGVVRIKSLTDMGLQGDELFHVGVKLLNTQMIGMLFGGLFWGVIGDKFGRMVVIYGSIVTFSIANLLNGFVTSIDSYQVLRFLSGVGIAGELGGSMTMISEIISPRMRGWATSLLASFGMLGAVAAGYAADYFSWRDIFIGSGILGLLIVGLRFFTVESDLFQTQKKASTDGAAWGSLAQLFASKYRSKVYFYCVLLGMPVWFAVGVIFTFAPEITKSLGFSSQMTAGESLRLGYMGLVMGDFASGALSQILKSRRKAIVAFLMLFTVAVLGMSSLPSGEKFAYAAFSFLIGCVAGYWSLFVTVIAENFGTNLRALAVTTIPNLVRNSVVLYTFFLQSFSQLWGFANAVVVLGVLVNCVAIFSVFKLRETFAKDLNYLDI